MLESLVRNKTKCSQRCDDVPLPGESVDICDKVFKHGLCDVYVVREKFCNKACRKCDDQSTMNEECSKTNAISCDVSALQSFKSTLFGGEFILSDWDGSNPCNWTYVTCSSVDGESTRVTKINLVFDDSVYANGMAGEIVPDFSKLRFLQDFRLSYQANVRGQFYPEYSVLDKLTHLLIWRTSVTGTYPHEYSVLTKLQHFTGSFNEIRGTIPVQFSSWKNLRRLFVGGNSLYGELPSEFSEWTSLRIFNARQNVLFGTCHQHILQWPSCISQMFILTNQAGLYRRSIRPCLI
eukprot:TRINITY_DN38650_c0_g2_i4.p1 TRINITY_DN38650_c0_g2~~TRINITY_DN38650_c0_g2_i4.p1  ORF type:complete len:293 (-),score=-15.46 TRINITY_DN38650_c0_g2_i4:653-1531(-)